MSVGGGRRWWRLLAVGLVLPLLAVSVLLWSVHDRGSRLDKVPVAIVNNDQIITSPQKMAAGRALTAALTEPSKPGKGQLDWTLTDKKDADAGLRHGSYYAVLTIPSDFSSSILSTGTDKPVQGKLSLVSNAAASSTLPYISQTVVAAAAQSLGDQSTQGYLKNVYGGFNQIAKSNSSAASSAGQLADGTRQLSSGAAQLDDGTDSLAGSLDKVASGSAQLADGTASVHQGAARVADGAEGVATGSRKLHRAMGSLARSARTLAGRSTALASRSRQLASGAAGVAGGAHELASGTRGLAAELAGLRAACSGAGGGPAFCSALDDVSGQARTVAGGAARLDGAAHAISGGNRLLAAGNDALAGGNRRLAGGATSLDHASGKLSSSAGRVSSGADSVARGAGTVDSSAGQLAGGTRSTSSAAGSLAAGSSQLSSSAATTNNGAQQLSSGLAKGAQESPTYSTSQQDALAPVVSQPVDLTSSLQHDEHGNGWLVAAILAVVLWLTAMIAAQRRDIGTVVRHALAPVSSPRLVLTQALPVAGVAALQAVAVLAAMAFFRVGAAAVVPVALVSLLAALVFSLVSFALRLAGGRAGTTVVVLLLVVQLGALGNVIPLETAPHALQRLNAVLPLTAYVNAASQLVSGGHVGSVVAATLVLLVWGAIAWAVMLSVVKRRRLVRPSGRTAVLEHSAA
jgi:putative membrane protein